MFSSSSFAVDRYDILEVGDSEYRDVVVRSKDASSLVVSHSKGIAQVPLSKLSRDLQRKYGYDSDSDAIRMAELDSIRERQIEESKQRLDRKRIEAESVSLAETGELLHGAFAVFGSPAELWAEVDFRSEFRELGIGVRNQGRRPSCAIHAVVGAIEFLEGRRRGEAENLSEHYLYWATLKTLGRYDQPDLWNDGDEAVDAGFSIPEVLQAIRTYGVPNVVEARGVGDGSSAQANEGPSESIVQLARKRSGIRSFSVPGRDKEILLGNIVHALNAGSPVVIGMAWPYYRSIRKSAYLEHQKPRPDYGHAVTLVGYRCLSGKLEDVLFVFRNSWGVKWGVGGYGYVKYEYIKENLFDAHVIEVDG